jgi:four helix bundle suffix protein
MQPYKKLYTYWFAVIIYDLTVGFCERYIASWKLREQMIGAARSGKQNIVEGSESLQTSLKSGIKLTGVAKASFEELIGDLEDFLRQRGLDQWGKQDVRVVRLRGYFTKEVRNLSTLSNLRDLGGKRYRLSGEPEKDANLLLTLCHQETYLLFRQVEGLMRKHEREGGLTERLYARRKKARGF